MIAGEKSGIIHKKSLILVTPAELRKPVWRRSFPHPTSLMSPAWWSPKAPRGAHATKSVVHTWCRDLQYAGWLLGRVQIYFCLSWRISGQLLLGRMSTIPVRVRSNVREAAKAILEKSFPLLF